MLHNITRQVSAEKGTLKGEYVLQDCPERKTVVRDMCELLSQGDSIAKVTLPSGQSFDLNVMGLIQACEYARKAWLIERDTEARNALTKGGSTTTTKTAVGF